MAGGALNGVVRCDSIGCRASQVQKPSRGLRSDEAARQQNMSWERRTVEARKGGNERMVDSMVV